MSLIVKYDPLDEVVPNRVTFCDKYAQTKKYVDENNELIPNVLLNPVVNAVDTYFLYQKVVAGQVEDMTIAEKTALDNALRTSEEFEVVIQGETKLKIDNSGIYVPQLNDGDLQIDSKGNLISNKKIYVDSYYYVENTTKKETFSSDFINYLTLQTKAIPSGTYKVNWSCLYGKNSTSNDYSARILIDDSINVIDPGNGGQFQIEAKDKGKDQRIPASGFRSNIYFGTEKAHKITFDFRQQSGGSAITYFANLELFRIY